MKKLYILIFFVSIATGYFIFRAINTDSTSKPIVIGMMNGWAPFMTINNHGEMEGFDVDVTKAIEKRIGQNIVIKDLGSLASLFIALQQGTVDAILSGLDVTEKRKKEYDFVIYESEKTKLNSYCCITSEKGPQSETDLENNTYSVGIEPALSWEATINKYTLLQKTYISSISDMILQLQQNKIDCFIVDPTQCNRIKKILPDLRYFEIDMDSSITIDGIGIFIKKDNTLLKNTLQQAVNTLNENKTIEKIAEKWNLG
jgi:ABC-type amino acid transport substrate-binding protein